jgi:hypothetical protein
LKTPENSRLFSRWRNPANGVESLILTERLAPVQRQFYFTNPNMTDDGRFMWVACSYPPEGGMHAVPVLAVVDFERDEMRVYHETQFGGESPLVDPSNGEIYWTNELDLWKRGPRPEDRPVRVNSFPRELTKGRRPNHIVSDLSFSADRKSVNLNTEFGNEEWLVGDIPLDGSPVRVWQSSDNRDVHCQFSPTDPDVQLLVRDYWGRTPEKFDPQFRYHRMYLLRRGGKPEPLLAEPITHQGHEWWDRDGLHVWFVHYGVAVKKVNIKTREVQSLWPGHLSHAHADRTGLYLVADMMENPAIPDCHVVFRNLGTGKEVEIVNRAPLAASLTQCRHLHPHPQFCQKDRYVCYTTTVDDRVDLALVPTQELIARSR